MIEASNTPKFQKRRSILAPPHLPQAFNLFVSALIVTHIFLSLIGQPIDYWIDFSQATSVSPLDRSLLAIHPLLFVALGLILLFFNNWLLPKLNRYVGLILWTPLCYLYIYHALSHISYDLDRLIPRIQAISFFVNIISFIVFSGIAGLLVTKMFSTSKNENVEVEKKSILRSKTVAWSLGVLITGWFLFLSYALVQATKIPDSGWVPISMETRPSPRRYIEISYDFNRNRAVMFGGEIVDVETNHSDYKSETWEWDGNNWTQKFSESNPQPRAEHAMAFDPNRGVTVLFGGWSPNGELADTWEWDGEQWKQMHPQVSPPARHHHSLVFDKQRGKVVLYGGSHQDAGWVWDGAEWAPIYSENEEPKQREDKLVYHDELNYVFESPNWILKENEWSELPLDYVPQSRYAERLAYNPDEAQIILFGGIKDEVLLNDTWIWNGEAWQEIDSPLPPSARRWHDIFYDPVRQRVLLFGGSSNNQILNDMWELSLAGE